MTNDNVFGLPSGFTASDVYLIWYLAHESIFEQNGRVLGKLGSRIVTEVLYGLVAASPTSIFKKYTNEKKPFKPKFKSKITGNFVVTFTDMFDFIGWL